MPEHQPAALFGCSLMDAMVPRATVSPPGRISLYSVEKRLFAADADLPQQGRRTNDKISWNFLFVLACCRVAHRTTIEAPS